MIVRARSVVTMNGAPIDNGAVVISGERIAEVGTFEAIKKHSTEQPVDLGERVLLPGLINAHCHLDYTFLRGRIARQQTFTDWIRAINAEKEGLTPEDYIGSINAGITEAAEFGTTTIVNFEAFPEIVSRISSPIRIWWLGELIDVRSKSSDQMMDRAAQCLSAEAHWGLAPHAPFTASPSLYRECQERAAAEGRLLSTHVAESNEEMMMFREATGPLYEFLQAIGRDLTDCGSGQTPLAQFLASIHKSSKRQPSLSSWLVAHLNELSESDFQLLESLGTKFHVVHCPRSHRFFDHRAFQFHRLRTLGFNICLGTDSLASNADLNLFEEMRAFRQANADTRPREIVEMITVKPARALHSEQLFGQISPGAYANLIAIDEVDPGDVYESILAHQGTIRWRMTNGTVVAA